MLAVSRDGTVESLASTIYHKTTDQMRKLFFTRKYPRGMSRDHKQSRDTIHSDHEQEIFMKHSYKQASVQDISKIHFTCLESA